MATNAEMYYPISVSVDDSGNVYTADFNNNRIRVITPNGFIKTIAGSVAGFADGVANTAGLMNSPIGTAVDAVGNIYVADYLNNRIRKITPMYCKPHAGTISGGVQICPCSPIKYSNTLTGGTWSVKTGHASINPTTGWTHAVTAGIDTVVYTLTDTCGTASVAYAITLLDSAICDSMKNIVGKKYVCLDTTYSNYKFTVGVAGGTWSSSGIYATVNDTGLVHAVSAGYDTIKYTIVDSCGTTIKTYPIRVLTKLQCDTANSVNEIANQDAMFISIFPNPATQSITINANNIIYPSCTIINYLGVVVDRITLTTNETNIGIQQLPTGMYYIRFVGKHGIDVRKFVKE